MIRKTEQGQVVSDVIEKAGRPLTPLEVHQLASQKIPRLGIATTYRHLRKLTEDQQVVGVDYPGQPPRYEWADGKDKVHFSCRSCDKLFALEDTSADIPPAQAPKALKFRASRLCFTGYARSADKNYF
jgi:Fur family ferric uptake transcriptional regulator